MAARVIPAHNLFMPWKPLANVSQKSFQHFLLISEITSVPVKGAILVLLLKRLFDLQAHLRVMSHVPFLVHLLEKQMQVSTSKLLGVWFWFWKHLSWTLSTHLQCSMSGWWLLAYGAPYGFRGSPEVLLGWAILLSLRVCFNSAPGWSSCRVHRIWCAFVQPLSHQYGWYCPSETVHKAQTKQFWPANSFFYISMWPPADLHE